MASWHATRCWGAALSGIGVVTNPMSRRNRRNPRLVERLAYILGDKGNLAQPTDVEGMQGVARRFMERDIDILCINGGDGTGHVVLSAMALVYGSRPLPRIALLRGGTMNTVAHGLGIHGDPSALLDRVVSKYHEQVPFHEVERNLLCVDGRHYGFLFGNGLASNYLEAYYEGSEPTPSKAMALMARVIGSSIIRGATMRRLLRPLRAQAYVDGVAIPATRFAAVAAATVDDLGFGFRPFWAAPSHPGRIHCLGFACEPMAIVRGLPRIYRGLPVGHPDIHDHVAQTLLIAGNAPMAYMVDGDFHVGGQVVKVTVGPRVRMIVG